MNNSNKAPLLIAAAAAVLTAVAAVALLGLRDDDAPSSEALTSPYVGQEERGIVALSQEDVEGLLTGAGTPFGGMARPAELNGYPGPRHILDAVEAGHLDVSDEQLLEIETLFAGMQADAIPLGEQIIEIEQAIDDAFSSGAMTEAYLAESIETSADLYGQLRTVHLSNHLATIEVLTPEQVTRYNELRGYTTDDPCDQAPPEGHDVDLWREHNNCS